jgi:inosose dehydratase
VPRRREFLEAAGAAAAAALLPGTARPDVVVPLIEVGYAAITWQGDDQKAIDEIAAEGFHGIQLRSPIVEAYRARPGELKRRLHDKGLGLLCLSSGNVDADPARVKEYLDLHVGHARFVKALGGKTLQVISRRPKGRAPTTAEFERLGALLSELGRRTGDEGVRLVYHNHMDGFGEAPEEVANVLAASDPAAVWLLLDIAHYQQGGGDPVAAVRRHRDRLAALHLKDVISPVPGDSKPPRQSYRWVELGRGSVDVQGAMKAVREVGFAGPVIIELDRPPEPGRTPRECAAINKRYAVETLGLTL